MMSRRAADMRSARARVERLGISESLESGAERVVMGCREGVSKERRAVGRRKEVST